ncbi:MAG TPA: phage tail tape measure protein [Hyphomicrobiaceae bacterium]|nr:phage tail tape measure protein [Hyphomicrobiaceae bacterium]
MDEQGSGLTFDITADASSLRRELADVSRLGRQFGSVLTNAFEGIALRGRSLSDVFRTMGLSLSKLAFNAAMKPFESAIGSIFQNLLGGFSIGAPTATPAQALPFPFAKGGVIASPVSFPLGRGATGLAGERGAEAIMPLSRGPDGRLGVAASGQRSMTVTFNVATPDVEGFRRSETQLSAMLARAVSQGQRNL